MREISVTYLPENGAFECIIFEGSKSISNPVRRYSYEEIMAQTSKWEKRYGYPVDTYGAHYWIGVFAKRNIDLTEKVQS